MQWRALLIAEKLKHLVGIYYKVRLGFTYFTTEKAVLQYRIIFVGGCANHLSSRDYNNF